MPSSPEFQTLLAKSEVGDEGDPVTTPEGPAYAIRVNGVTPTKLRPLDSVRPQVVAAWTEEQRQRQFATMSAELAAKAGADHNLTAVAAQLHTAVQSSGTLLRKSTSPALTPQLISKIFSQPAGTTLFGPGTTADTYVIARVTGVRHPPTPYNNPRFKGFTERLGGSAGNDISDTFATAWRDKLGYSVNQSVADHLTGGGS